MKGIVFTEFFELVEEKFGYEMIDTLISKCELESEGIYTSVGTYDSEEMHTLVDNLSILSGVPKPQLLNAFGHHMFKIFEKNYNAFFSPFNHAFDFLKTLHNHIHVEVQKLYPDAELPKFDYNRISENKLEMIYTSSRQMSDLATGLLEAVTQYYNHEAKIETKAIIEDGTQVQFIIVIN